jgi:cytochrome c nitrite reductase small subunit
LDLQTYLDRKAKLMILLGMVAALVLLGGAISGMAFADSPAFCASCHTMNDAHASWSVSKHQQFKCTDCHLPHSYPEKLVEKARTGMHDTYAQMTGNYPSVIRVTAKGKEVLVENCQTCHAATIAKVKMGDGGDCMRCHRGIGHGKTQ